jgi:hypothetical protein
MLSPALQVAGASDYARGKAAAGCGYSAPQSVLARVTL